MKKIFLFIFLLTSSFYKIAAQDRYTGKYYVSKPSVSCDKMTGGGCTIYIYSVLKFDKDSVEVSYPKKAICTTTEYENDFYNSNNNYFTRKYRWFIAADKLVIDGFTDYNKYSFQEKDERYIKTLYPVK